MLLKLIIRNVKFYYKKTLHFVTDFSLLNAYYLRDQGLYKLRF